MKATGYDLSDWVVYWVEQEKKMLKLKFSIIIRSIQFVLLEQQSNNLNVFTFSYMKQK